MPETYTTVADGIIRDSIRSVIFVDDQLALPFETNADENQLELSSGIYTSFTEQDSGLDFYKYMPGAHWEFKKDYFFKGRDLMVIDWQLDVDDHKHRNTLRILQEAVNQPSLHFVCIYTATEVAEFVNILYQIGTYFTVSDREKAENIFGQIKELIEKEDEEAFEKMFSPQMHSKLKELVLYRERSNALMSEIRQEIVEATSGVICGSVKKILLSAYSTEKEGFIAIGALNDGVITGSGNDVCDVSLHTEDHFIRINHTLIVLLNKDEVKPNTLYTRFSQAVIASSGNFLTLLGLEMRNLYRAGSAFIGKDIDSISELAFFYHQRQSHPAEAFSEFLGELYKNQSFSFLYDRNTQPKLLDHLPDYIAEKGLNDAIAAFSPGPDTNEDIARLNYYYNILKTKRVEADRVRFGDIFKLNPLPNSSAHEYLLCITAHCDCLYSDKIGNMFYFIKGTKDGLESALQKGDTGFHSYIVNDKSVEAIKWMDKPFTIYIAPEKNNIDLSIIVNMYDQDRQLNYHSTIKENYAQRMANQAASYPLRVGIFFADFKPAHA